MAYEPNEWACGDIITAEKMNAMERGIADMNAEYVPNEWSSGETITAEKLNHMEQGIANGGGSSDYPTITATYDDTIQGYVYTCDWTFSEIMTKIETSAQESKSWAGIYIEVGYDGTMGGTWGEMNAEGTTILQLNLTDSSTFIYDSNGNLELVK